MNWVRLFVGGPTGLCGGGEAGGSWIRQRMVVVRKRRRGTGVRRSLVPSATAGGVPLVLARFVEGLSTHQSVGCPCSSAVRLPGDIADAHVGVQHVGADDHRTGSTLKTTYINQSSGSGSWSMCR